MYSAKRQLAGMVRNLVRPVLDGFAPGIVLLLCTILIWLQAPQNFVNCYGELTIPAFPGAGAEVAAITSPSSAQVRNWLLLGSMVSTRHPFLCAEV